jgi:hypothetical protein
MCPAAARSWPHAAPPPPPRRRPFLLRLAIVPSSVVVSVAAPSFSIAPSFPSPPRQRQQPRLSVPAHEGADNGGSLSSDPLMHGAGELEQGAGEPLRLPSGVELPTCHPLARCKCSSLCNGAEHQRPGREVGPIWM